MILGRGELTLSNGRATVALRRIPEDALVLLSPKSLLGTVGALSWSVSRGAGFTVTSVSLLDQSVVGWVVLA